MQQHQQREEPRPMLLLLCVCVFVRMRAKRQTCKVKPYKDEPNTIDAHEKE